MRALITNLLVLVALAALTIYFAHLFASMQKGMDFASFYAAAQVVRQGEGHRLYDVMAQNEFLARYGGRTGIYYIHPPFETLVYLPFSLWSFSRAYLLWCLFNMGLLAVVARTLARYALPRWHWRALLPVFFLFVPVVLNFMHGQDSVLLLFCLVSAFAALKCDREFAAGCFLALGLFKPHLAIPAALPVLATGQKKVLAGFASVATALVLLSAGISGWGILTSYPRFLVQLGQLPLAGVHKQQMANLRAVFGLAFPESVPIALSLTVLTSLLVLYLTVRSRVVPGHSGITELAAANAVIGSVLVSYHLSPHDLTILLLPMSLIIHHLLSRRAIPAWSRTLLLATLAVIFLPPLHLLLLWIHIYTYLAIPIVLLFGATYAEIRRISAADHLHR